MEWTDKKRGFGYFFCLCFYIGSLFVIRPVQAYRTTTVIIEYCPNTTKSRGLVEKPSPRYHLGINLSGIMIRQFIDSKSKEDKKSRGTGVVGGEIDFRYYSSSPWIIGGKLILGGSITDEITGTGFGVVVEPIIGYHWTKYTRDISRNLPGSYIRGSRRCDRTITELVYSTHTLGIQPSFMWVNQPYVGGHVVWEYDFYIWGKTSSYLLTGTKSNPIDLRLKSAFRAGYVHGLGVGGGWTGSIHWWVLSIEAGLGLYYLTAPSLTINISVGAWIF